MTRKPYVFSAVALLALTALAFAVGRYPVSPGEVLSALAGQAADPSVNTVVLQVRGPRVLAALLVGAALAAAGTAYQGMFRNPLVSPDILGVSTGAALGAVLGIFLSSSILVIQLFAFAGGLMAVGLVYGVGARLRGHDPLLALVLTGVVIGTLLGSVIALLKVLADPSNQLPAITFWLLDSLASISPGDLGVAAPLTLLGLLPSHSGRILLQNDSIEALSRSEIARRIGYVPQGHAAYFAFKRNLHPLLEP